jgi:hypothetical protein
MVKMQSSWARRDSSNRWRNCIVSGELVLSSGEAASIAHRKPHRSSSTPISRDRDAGSGHLRDRTRQEGPAANPRCRATARYGRLDRELLRRIFGAVRRFGLALIGRRFYRLLDDAGDDGSVSVRCGLFSGFVLPAYSRSTKTHAATVSSG